jgi:hypothetical protein
MFFGVVCPLEQTPSVFWSTQNSHNVMVGLKITIDQSVRNLLFDQNNRMLAISRVIVPISGFGQNPSVVRLKASTKLKL